ncbi:rCG52055, partial [Rattus norvegicus]
MGPGNLSDSSSKLAGEAAQGSEAILRSETQSWSCHCNLKQIPQSLSVAFPDYSSKSQELPTPSPPHDRFHLSDPAIQIL